MSKTITPEFIALALGHAPNTNCLVGMRCPNPNCLSTETFLIGGYIWDDDGCGESNENWTPTTECRCCACDYQGLARDFDDTEISDVFLADANKLLTWADETPLPVSAVTENNQAVVAYRMAHLMMLAWMRGRAELQESLEKGEMPEMVAYRQIRRIILDQEGIC